MSTATIPLDVKAAEQHLMTVLSVEGVTGEEKAIAAAVTEALTKVGVPASAIRFDEVDKKIPVPTQTGNLIVELPGTRPGPRLLFSSHLDTVLLCRGAKPVRKGDRVVNENSASALGGDARSGCAVLITLAETLIKHAAAAPADHAAVHRAGRELVFTARANSIPGTWAARRCASTWTARTPPS